MSNTKELGQIIPRNCPICGKATNYTYGIENKDEQSLWYRCICGVIFQKDLPKHDKYDEKYIAGYCIKKIQDKYEYYIHIYGPLIEELTYGRKMLDVGFGLPYTMEALEKRGWLTWGIEKNDSVYKTGGNIVNGDFETFDFRIPLSKDAQEQAGVDAIDRKFDLIWMGHVFEHFNDPKKVLQKAYNLLDYHGVLFISTPDVNFIHQEGVAGWPHWKKHEHYIMWNEKSLNREAERIGFKTVMSRKNFAARFTSWWDVHAIYQKTDF